MAAVRKQAVETAAVRGQSSQDGCGTGKGSAAAMPVAFPGNGRRCMSRRVAQAVLVRLSGDSIATNG
ncbi:MAG: hypothetical protein GXY61_13225 [Lentisphaerae bacterium]|nr:hypothetical protein [Lentisphaerota bacterium]